MCSCVSGCIKLDHNVFIKVNLDCVTVYDEDITIIRNFGYHSPNCTIPHLTEDRIIELRLYYVSFRSFYMICIRVGMDSLVVTDYSQSMIDLSNGNCSSDYKRD